MPKVSILVPVYNVEKYLLQCIESIINQSLQDIEIICIDDGSTDQSGKMLDDFALKDVRVRVLHKKNAGYGAALNDGLKIATGEYIGIVESDDKVAKDMYKTLYATACEHDLDFVKSEVYYWYEEIDYLKRIHTGSVEQYFDKVLGENERNIFFDFFMNIWTGIYRKSFLEENHIVFNESPGASYQDNGFWMQTCFYAQRVMWLNQAFYYYRQDNPEASVKSSSKMLAMTKEYEYLEQLLKNRGHENLLPYCYSMKLFRMRGTFYRIADEKKIEFLEQVKHDYGRYKAYIRDKQYVDKWFRTFLEEQQELCDRIAFKKEALRKQIREASAFIIYGAGRCGDEVLRTLYNEGLYDKISCFAQSETPQSSMIASKPIYVIEEALERFPQALVMIAVGYKTNAYNNMSDRLERLGVTEYINMVDIHENFYIL